MNSNGVCAPHPTGRKPGSIGSIGRPGSIGHREPGIDMSTVDNADEETRIYCMGICYAEFHGCSGGSSTGACMCSCCHYNVSHYIFDDCTFPGLNCPSFGVCDCSSCNSTFWGCVTNCILMNIWEGGSSGGGGGGSAGPYIPGDTGRGPGGETTRRMGGRIRKRRRR